MNKYVLMLAAAGLIAAAPVYYAVSAQAEDAAPAADAAHAEHKEATLKDGTKVSIEGDAVFVVGADGAKTPAPDGEHELEDGSKVTTKDGKLVH